MGKQLIHICLENADKPMCVHALHMIYRNFDAI